MWPYVHCICVITPTLSMISQPPYIWYHIQYTCDILSTIFVTSYPLCITTLCVVDTTFGICMTSFALQKTSHPLYHSKLQSLWLHIHFRHDITPTVSDIAPTVSLSSQPLHWYHTQFCMTSYPLCMTTQHCVLLIPHSAYVWHHLHYTWYHIHSNTPNHSIYDVTSTSGMASQPQYHTSHPLCLCHHNISTDIIPTFVWHHTHSMCHIKCTLHHINSLCHHPTVLMTSQPLYMKPHPVCRATNTLYISDITATNLCHHSHSIDNITHTLYDITLG